LIRSASSAAGTGDVDRVVHRLALGQIEEPARVRHGREQVRAQRKRADAVGDRGDDDLAPAYLEGRAERIRRQLELGEIGAIDADAERLIEVRDRSVGDGPWHLPPRPGLDGDDQRGGARAARFLDQGKAVDHGAGVGHAGLREKKIARTRRHGLRVVENVDAGGYQPEVAADVLDDRRGVGLKAAVEPDLHEGKSRGQGHPEQRSYELAAVEKQALDGNPSHR